MQGENERLELEYMLDKVANLYAKIGPLKLGLARNEIPLAYRDAEGLLLVAIAVKLLLSVFMLLEKLYERVIRAASSVETIESPATLGYLDVQRTIRNIVALRPPVWRVVRRGLNPNDRVHVCSLYNTAVGLADRAKRIMESVEEASATTIYGELDRLLKKLGRLSQRVKSLHRRLCGFHPESITRNPCLGARHACNVCDAQSVTGVHSKLLSNLCALHSMLYGEKASRVAIVRRVKDDTEYIEAVLRVYAQRLYELYVLYMLLRALEGLTPGRIQARKERVIVLEYDGSIIIFYNSKPRVDGMLLSRIARGKAVPQLGPGILEAASGRPDITLVVGDRVVAVFEVKYSRRLSYLTAARFKTLAYIHEYDAQAGVLVYPGLGATSSAYEEEDDVDTIRLLAEAEKNGTLAIRLYGNSTLYILPLSPREDVEEENIERMRRVLRSLVALP